VHKAYDTSESFIVKVTFEKNVAYMLAQVFTSKRYKIAGQTHSIMKTILQVVMHSLLEQHISFVVRKCIGHL